MPELSKLQIRAKVLSVITEIKSQQKCDKSLVEDFIKKLSDINDKKALFDIYLKEFIKLEESEYVISSYILKELVPKDYICDKTYELLKSKNLSDETKYKLVQLLRIIGAADSYMEIPSYFDNPHDILDLETKKLLETAVFNPESMLDFLDFVSNVNYTDRSILLKSLSLDYEGNVLANIVYPILYSDFEDEFLLEAIEVLSDSKSSIALAPFEYLIKTSNNPQIVKACEIGLKKLKFSGASQDKADEYFSNIIKNTRPIQFYTTIPDGHGNQAILISRINTDGNCLLYAVVINDISGVIDCFGFYNISQEELLKIIDKFYTSEGKYHIPREYAKTKINSAINNTVKYKRKFPYEFICWNPMIYDIKELDFSFKEYADKNCKIQILSKPNILKFLTLPYTFRWFITPKENNILADLIQKFYSKETISVEDFNKELISQIDNIFDTETENIWKNKIYDLIYLLRNNNKLKDADNFYTIVSNKDNFMIFKTVTVQKSIFNYFVSLADNLKDSSFTTNIFKKKNSNESKYDLKRLEKIIEVLKKNWLYE